MTMQKEAFIDLKNSKSAKLRRPAKKKLSYIFFLCTIFFFVFLYADVPKTVQNLSIAKHLYFIYNALETKPEILVEKKLNDVYVILSGDMNYHYLLATPLVVQHWLNLNISSIVMLCGKEKEYEDDPAGREVISELNRLGAELIFLRNKTLNSNNFAQNMRNYAAATTFVQEKLNNNTILMTSDVDFYPFHKEHHVPDLTKRKEIFFYNIDCCGNQEWKGLKYKQYVMITIAMTVRRWKEVMDILPTDRATGDYIENKTNAAFDYELGRKLYDSQWMWYLDQRLFGLQYHRADKIHNYAPLISSYKYKKRLDRSTWKSYTKSKFKSMDFSKVDDAHTSPAIYTDTWWNLNLPFYERIFTKGQMQNIIKYRERAVKFVNPNATANRHFHP